MEDDRESPQQHSGATPKQPSGKAVYVKPGFRHEQVFESMALACGKMSPTQAQCHSVRKSS